MGKNGNIFFYGRWLAKVKLSAMDETYTGRYLMPYVNGKPGFSANNRNFNTFIWVFHQT